MGHMRNALLIGLGFALGWGSHEARNWEQHRRAEIAGIHAELNGLVGELAVIRASAPLSSAVDATPPVTPIIEAVPPGQVTRRDSFDRRPNR